MGGAMNPCHTYGFGMRVGLSSGGATDPQLAGTCEQTPILTFNNLKLASTLGGAIGPSHVTSEAGADVSLTASPMGKPLTWRAGLHLSGMWAFSPSRVEGMVKTRLGLETPLNPVVAVGMSVEQPVIGMTTNPTGNTPDHASLTVYLSTTR